MKTVVAALAVVALSACTDEQPAAPGANVDPVLAVPESLDALALDVSAPKEVDEGATLTLASNVTSGSSAGGLAFEWKQLGDGPRAKLSTPYAANTTLQAPESTSGYGLEFEIVVTRAAEVVRRTVTIAVRADDDPPEAEVIVPERSECGSRVVLVGQGRSYEPMQALRFDWKQIGDGPRVQLENSKAQQTSFVAPEIHGGYVVWFDFHVRDGVNPDVVAHAEVTIECDGKYVSLPKGRKRALADAAVTPQPLPRGRWDLEGSLELAQEATDRGAVVTLRFEYAPLSAAAFQFAKNGARAGVRMCGLVRDSAAGEWREPASSGQRDLGEWPADQPLGFAFEWDGQELGVHWGPPGAREKWPELPIPVTFPLASRPHMLAVIVDGGAVKLGDTSLTGR